MSKTILIRVSSLVLYMLFFNVVNSQQLNGERETKGYNSRFGTEVRGKNALFVGIGASLASGDLPNPIFEFNSHIGYKRFVGPYANINVSYHKFNIAFKDVYNEGFMSFDLNLELNAFPYNSFNFFVFGGGGLNASNYFKSSDYKVQGGAGIELLAIESVGLFLRGELNKMFSDDLDGVISGEANDLYWRMSFGVNFYFEKRHRKKRIKKDDPTVINSNPIINQ